MQEQPENPDAAPPHEPTGVINVKIEKVEDFWRDPAQQRFGFAAVQFHVGDEVKQVITRRLKFSEGDRAVFVPNGSVLPDEPEFSNIGARRRKLEARGIAGRHSDGILISYDDVAWIMSRRAFKMAQTEEEVALLTGRDADYLFDAALAALYEIPLGVDLGESLGIFPFEDPDEEVVVKLEPEAAIALGLIEPTPDGPVIPEEVKA